MEIGIVRQRYTPYGGAERFVADALSALRSEGVSLTLYTRKWPGDDGTFAPEICNPFFIGSVWRDWSFARAVKARWARHRPDLIQTHERISGCDIFRAGDGVHAIWLEQRAREMAGLRRFGLFLNPYHHYTLAAEDRLFRDPTLRGVICNSKLVRDQIRERFGIPEHKLHLIYNAVDSTRFSPALRTQRAAIRGSFAIPDGACLFLMVGSGYQRKGAGRAIAALAGLPPSVRLLIAGKDKNIDRYRGQARAAGVAERVAFAGAVDDVRPLLGAADAFVLPTLYDPLPNACLEAMAAGLPVITSTQCGAAELLIANECGIVADALDTSAVAAAMTRLLDPTLRTAMGARARSAVAPLTREAMAAQLLALYKTSLGMSAG